MFIEERHQEIIDTINHQGKITIAEIVNNYGISEESARRDLRQLEQRGFCQRTHGGAIALKQVSVRPLANREYASMPIYNHYKQISKKAAEIIQPNDVVYMTGGSFGYIMLSFLPRNFSYTLVVNNVDIAKELRAFDNVDVYLAGGKMRQSGSLVDSLATEFVSKLHFDCCFITGAGVTYDFGLSNGTDETATFQRSILKNSRKRCLLMPSDKVGVNSFIKVCDVHEFDLLITDWGCAEEHIAAMEDGGVKVMVVEE